MRIIVPWVFHRNKYERNMRMIASHVMLTVYRQKFPDNVFKLSEFPDKTCSLMKALKVFLLPLSSCYSVHIFRGAKKLKWN